MSAIGIDLGTTYSCVAVHKKGRVDIIANDANGSRLTPSCVSFNEYERFIGEAAKQEATMNSKNTLFHIKRIIGRKFNDPNVQEDMKMWAFDVVNEGGRPHVQVTYKGEIKKFSPEQISAMILQQLKMDAEAYTGQTITDAVITVPAYFNVAQRKATRDAGRIAGLNVLSIINEPTAAAIAYGLDTKNNDTRNVLIFDLGGGTFDVTIATIRYQIFDIKATDGDTHLGGEDINNRMVKYFVEEIKQKHGVDISDSRKALSKLNEACEQAKKKLSVATYAKIQIDDLYKALNFKSNMSRAKFEDINMDLFESTLALVKRVLADAKLRKDQLARLFGNKLVMLIAKNYIRYKATKETLNEKVIRKALSPNRHILIDDIVLVGGSTRILKIRELLKDFFDGKEMCRTINPDEAVAQGAAELAQNIKSGKDMKTFRLRDVTSISIGTNINGEEMHIVIPRNTNIPTKKKMRFYTTKDNQRNMEFAIYEGERACIHDNHHLGTFELSGIKPAPATQEAVDSVFEIDRSGILTVTACVFGTEIENNIKIEEMQLTEIELKKMIIEAEIFRAEDRARKERNAAKNELEELAYKIKQVVVMNNSPLSPGDQKKIMEKSKAAISWVNANNKIGSLSIRQRTQELKRIFNSMRGISSE